MKDKYRFYILAKYNDIANPNRLPVGQVIKIPGREPAPAPVAKPAAKPPADSARPPSPPTPVVTVKPEASAPAPAPVPAAEPKKEDLIARYSREAKTAEAKQDLKTAIARWDQVLQLDPDNELARLSRARAIDLQKRIDTFGAGKK